MSIKILQTKGRYLCKQAVRYTGADLRSMIGEALATGGNVMVPQVPQVVFDELGYPSRNEQLQLAAIARALSENGAEVVIAAQSITEQIPVMAGVFSNSDPETVREENGKRLLKYDLHQHPLGHKYYSQFNPQEIAQMPLDDEDEESVRLFVRRAVARNVDILALSDHDDLRAGFYAKQYAQEANLNIAIIPAAECEVTDSLDTEEERPVHILVFGLDELPEYGLETDALEFCRLAKAKGATLVMPHPNHTPGVLEKLAAEGVLYGAEVYNRDGSCLAPGELPAQLAPFVGSDLHFMETRTPMAAGFWTEAQAKDFLQKVGQ